MSLLNDILVWASQNLTPWQRDAMRRLFLQQELSTQDYDDLYAMLKSAHGLPDIQNRQSIPLAKERLPVQDTRASPVILRALRDLKNVNRIAPGQELKFSPKGITVIYGGTATGKSGYARVLKRACRARDVSETVHPDASDPGAANSTPEAIFDIEVGGTASPVVWTRDSDPPDQLSTIAVFDGRCARAYLDAEQDVAYLPYGLDIVQNLGQEVLPTLSQRLDEEIAALDTDTTPFSDLLGETTVGQMVQSLSASTDPKTVTALGTLSPSETERLAELDKALSEQDPKAKADALRLSPKRIDALVTRIDSAYARVDDAAIEKLKQLDSETEAACEAEVLAAARLRAKDSLLPGTGEDAWRKLFEAGRRFSVDKAYPSEQFPFIGLDARCPLCQKPLELDAAERMRRFEEFVQQDTAKAAASKRDERKDAAEALERVDLAFHLNTPDVEELRTLNEDAFKAVQQFEEDIESRRRWILSAVKAHTWDDVPPLEGDPRPMLKSISNNISTQVVNLDKAANEEEKKTLESERAELRARAALASRLQPVLNLIARLQQREKLTKTV